MELVQPVDLGCEHRSVDMSVVRTRVHGNRRHIRVQQCVRSENSNRLLNTYIDDYYIEYMMNVTNIDNERKIDILRYPRDPESIKIDEHGDVYCQAWGNYRVRGLGSTVETVEMINHYIDECAKPKNERDFSFINIFEHHEDEYYTDDKLLISENALVDFID